MDHVRLDIIQQTLVVRDHDSRILWRTKLVDTICHDAEGIDIQTAIRLIENRQLRFEHCHLEDFVPLLLTTRKTFVHAAARQLIVQFHNRTLLAHQLQEVGSRNRFQPFIFTMFVQGGTHEVHHADSRNLHRILETQENTFTATVFRFEIQQALTVEDHLPFRYFECRITDQHTAQGTFPGTVRPHDGVYLTRLDRKVDSFQYLFAIDIGM